MTLVRIVFPPEACAACGSRTSVLYIRQGGEGEVGTCASCAEPRLVDDARRLGGSALRFGAEWLARLLEPPR